jgi:hypothetical protein
MVDRVAIKCALAALVITQVIVVAVDILVRLLT